MPGVEWRVSGSLTIMLQVEWNQRFCQVLAIMV